MAVADQYAAEQATFAAYAATETRKLWSRVGDDLDAGWYPLVEQAATAVAVAQTAAVISSAAYTPAALGEYGIPAAPVGDLDTLGFSGISKQSTAVSQVLTGATTYAKNLIKIGWDVADARQSAGKWLSGTTLTLVNDAGRGAASVDIAQRPTISGYVRVESPGCCVRCLPLAGKWFRWNEGFQRHPRCRGHHQPAKNEAWAKAEGFITDPYERFNGMTAEEQDKFLGVNDAQAVRDGADIYRVLNGRNRGLGNAQGRSGWQARRYGTPTKLTVDDIYREAGSDRKKAVQMMLDEGYITGPQEVGGNIKGRYYEGYGQMGRGGTRVGASIAVDRARRSGIRDPYLDPTGGTSLDPATQTSAERRLHRAYLDKRAMDEGRNPYSTSSRPISAAERALVLSTYRAQVNALPSQPLQVQRLARLLGIR